MPLLAVPRPHPIRIALLALVAITFVFAAEAAAMQASKRVAKEAASPALDRTVLTTLKGKTLYSLSVEKRGKFICTGGCLASWRPLLVPKGVKPTGPVKLGTIKRPEGKTQVTYKGLPLYSFNGDRGPREANGEGLKDVGTWHAAKVAEVSPPAPGPQPEPEPPYPY